MREPWEGRDALAIVGAVGGAAAALGGFLRDRFGTRTATAAVTMGSGLADLADAFEDPLVVPYDELPGFPRPTVEGHEGEAVLGTLRGVPAIGLRGRVHIYEGGDVRRTAFYARVLGALDVPILFLSNAAGAIREGMHPGELMLVTDHINLTGRSPLIGPVFPEEARFPDMTAPYDPELREIVTGVAGELGVLLHSGVYAAVHGPSYETPAEIRMLRTLGADAVGMSTVPEVIAARAQGIRCVAVSCLTNYASGVTDRPLSHQEVIRTTKIAQADFQRLVATSIGRFADVLR